MEECKVRLDTRQGKGRMGGKNAWVACCIGTQYVDTNSVDGSRLKEGDMAGLDLMKLPYDMLAVKKDGEGWQLEWYDQRNDEALVLPLNQ